MTEAPESSAPSQLVHALPAALGAGAAAARLLPWWQADRGAMLLGRSITELPPDSWTGVEVTGPFAPVLAVSAGVAVLLALVTCLVPACRCSLAARVTG